MASALMVFVAFFINKTLQQMNSTAFFRCIEILSVILKRVIFILRFNFGLSNSFIHFFMELFSKSFHRTPFNIIIFIDSQ